MVVQACRIRKAATPDPDVQQFYRHLDIFLTKQEGRLRADIDKLAKVDQGRYMTGFHRVRDGFFDERPRGSDLTKLPLSDGEERLCDRAGIQAEAESGLTIPLGIVNAQRLN
jgi:hypothetical protein